MEEPEQEKKDQEMVNKSEVELLKELREEIKALDTCTPLKTKFLLLSFWTFLINLVTVWNILYVPYFICFRPDYVIGLKISNCIFDVMYILVIFFRIYKCVLKDNLYENRIDPNMKHYHLKKYFKGKKIIKKKIISFK